MATRPRTCYETAMRSSLAIQSHRAAILEIVQRHRARNPRIFGSDARGDDQEGSDLDLLVDPAPGMTLFDIDGLACELETLLGLPVDVVTPAGLPAAFAAIVQRDMRAL